ncbi:Plant/F21F14-40 protein [Quillaja saponaria]|uniref:Plant/F21F14-40 protein n=1 Tax=Quillaja saponaria TaxID=32244 RepID=A0AAD7L4T9_QUISA|nr:Plant/F21F14-40 protein [Quillaja saponaria]
MVEEREAMSWVTFVCSSRYYSAMGTGSSLVSAMLKGSETARNLHITLNALNVLLFGWQIPTGIDIVSKAFEFT